MDFLSGRYLLSDLVLISMKKLLIATSNPGKKIEILKALETIIKEFELLTLDNFPNISEPEETGKTFEENALIKAKYYALATNLPTIADDGGIMIDALNGEPGVRSRRWPGYTATDEELIQMTLEKMKNIKDSDRQAQLATCACLYIPSSNKYFFSSEKILGKIAHKPIQNYKRGYPFRALFIVSKLNLFYDQLTDALHDKMNHRIKAVKKLIKEIEKYI